MHSSNYSQAAEDLLQVLQLFNLEISTDKTSKLSEILYPARESEVYTVRQPSSQVLQLFIKLR